VNFLFRPLGLISFTDAEPTTQHVDIIGGTYTYDPEDDTPQNNVAEGYRALDNGNGTWTVLPEPEGEYEIVKIAFYALNEKGEYVNWRTAEVYKSAALNDSTYDNENPAETDYYRFDGTLAEIEAEAAELAGRPFSYWTDSAEGTEEVLTEKTVVDADISVYAKYLYKVSYEFIGGVPSGVTAPEDEWYDVGDTVYLTAPEKTSAYNGGWLYVVGGWNAKDGFEMSAEDVVIKGSWKGINSFGGGGSSGGGGYVDIEDEETPLAGPSVFTTEHIAYVNGKDGYIKPEEHVTRAEVADMFYRLLNDETLWDCKSTENNFADVNEGDWFNEAISTLANLGILEGAPDGNFYPNANITRAEFATILARFDYAPTVELGVFADSVGHWAEEEICMAYAKGWVEGNDEGNFCPDNNLTRAEIVTVINRMVGRNPQSVEDLLDDMIVWEDNKNTEMWYYLAIQEATNGHSYGRHEDETEYWTGLK
jgi:hypothetical protein